MEEQDGRRRRQQEKISILCWSVRTRNSVPSRSSTSFRTQSHWPYTAGQCVNFEHFSSTGILLDVHSVHAPSQIQDWWREENSSRERQTVFLTVVNTMNKNHKDPQLIKPRLALHNPKWKRHQDTVYWVEFQLAQRKGLKFYQTRSNAIILHDTFPVYCISKVVVIRSDEIIYQKVYVSFRPTPKISDKHNWMCDLDCDVVGSSKDHQRIQPVCGQESIKEIEKRAHVRSRHSKSRKLDESHTQQVQWDPFVGQNLQSVSLWHLHMLKKIKQVRWDPHWKPQRGARNWLRSSRIDKENAFFFWSHGVIYCICGHLLVKANPAKIFHRWRLDALSNLAVRLQRRATSWCSAL